MLQNKIIQSLLRWGLTVALFFWLFKSGKLTGLDQLDKLLHSPLLLVTAILLFILNYGFNFLRWDILLRGASIHMPFSEIIRLSMIGQFFSIIMPGAVGGDVLKAIYVAKKFPENKTDGVTSIFLDRVLGFLTLMIFASFFFMLSFDATHLPVALQGFGTLLALGTTLLLLAVLLPKKAADFLDRFAPKNALFEKFSKVLRAFSRSKRVLLWGLGASFLSQGCSIFAMCILGQVVFGDFPWGNLSILRFVSASAVGTTASAIPISPMGLGVGQIAFGKVFKLLGAPSEDYGVVVISATQIIGLFLNLSGALWFLKSQSKNVVSSSNASEAASL